MPSGGERQSGVRCRRAAAAAVHNPIHMFCQISPNSPLYQVLRRQWHLVRGAGGCSDESDSPTQVALCSNLSLLTLTHPENPRNPPASLPSPTSLKCSSTPPFHLTFDPTNHTHIEKQLFTKTKLSRHVRTEQHRAGRRAAPHCAPSSIRPRRKPAGEPSTRPLAAERVFFSNAKHSPVCSCRHAAVLREFPAPVGDLVSSNIIGNILGPTIGGDFVKILVCFWVILG